VYADVWSHVRRRFFVLLLELLLFIALIGCRGGGPALAPPIPPALSATDGYASLIITQGGETAKSRFSFRIEFAGRGKIEAFDPLGRTVVEIYLLEPDAYFVLPSEKVYWKASPREIAERFLGAPLGLSEIAGLISGQWAGFHLAAVSLERWRFERDADGRLKGGERDGFSYDVREFFRASPIPRRIDFRSPSGRGSLRLLSIAFNNPGSETLFRLDFLSQFSSRSWPEIERLWKNGR
jgi:hypothetical protein